MMKHDYPRLCESLHIGSVTLRNRMCSAPMGFPDLTEDGCLTDGAIAFYENRAKGGAAIVTISEACVDYVNGKSHGRLINLTNPGVLANLTNAARAIKRHGAIASIELNHAGMLSDFDVVAQDRTRDTAVHYGASDCVLPSGTEVRAMNKGQISAAVSAFAKGAALCKKAGFDMVMIHAGHGWLLHQFLSPATNRRTDEYGGSLENRMRFLRNIILGIRQACGSEYPLIVRLTADECYARIGKEGTGYDLTEGIQMAKELEKLGIDAIDVSSAGYDTFNYWLEPVSFEPGWRKYMAKAIKENVKIPVIAANLIRSPEQAESQIQEGVQDFVSFGRPHIADPDIVAKAMQGKPIRRCICCLNCIESMQTNAYTGGHGECAVNPFVGSEGKDIPKNGNGRKIVVIGAGAAGLTAAYILGMRGFSVTVLEKSDSAGGQLKLASAPPLKEKIGWFIEDLLALCEENGVEIRYNTPADAEAVKALSPYAVITACGSKPIKPVFGGQYTFDDLVTFEDVLNGKVKFEGKRIAVIGSGMTGLETAEYLNSQGNKTVVIEMADTVAPGTWMQHTDDILPRLQAAGTEVRTGQKLCDINPDCIVTENVKTGNRSTLMVDGVVLALGSSPDKSMADALNKAGIKNVFNVGDSAKVGRIQNATSTAWRAAMQIN